MCGWVNRYILTYDFFFSGLNLAGFFDPLLSNFGVSDGNIGKFLPDSDQSAFFYASALLVVCICISLIGASFFSRSGSILFVILAISILSIPLSVLLVNPYTDHKHGDTLYTGFSLSTFSENFLPHFTSGAAGSDSPGKQTFKNMFGIFFPATSGIFAGASMSGDLRKPSKSIPQGTLWGLLATVTLYVLVILSIGCSVSRELLHRDVHIIQNINISPYIILMGELSTSLYSSLIGVVGASKLLQAIARDGLVPFSKYFSKGEGNDDNPIRAIFLTYILTQLTLLFDINQIAVFITMAYLMTFVVTNLACYLLKIASAPNFRPSFRFFNSYTAGFGALFCAIAMFIADGFSAAAMIILLIVMFLSIHYISPPKPWGDVSQSLIYHQVRKYLLRLRQDHVKFWRPQILLLVDDPKTSWSLIHFCNHLKKGGLYILGHVMVTNDFHESYPEMKKQRDAWSELRNASNIKGFVQVAAGPDVVWGARNVYMGSGLGGMKPNITVMGFFEKENHDYGCSTKHNKPRDGRDSIDMEHLPTDICRKEPSISVTQWVHIIEDLLTMQANIAIAKGFPSLEFPSPEPILESKKGYIDLYPIQMSAQLVDEDGQLSAMTTNFDTYTLILQMGAILRTVPAWKKNHDLRVVVFVEFEEDLESERERIKILLEKLRIKAEILVMHLNSGSVGAYETIIHGKPDHSGRVHEFLGNDEWWQELQDARNSNNNNMDDNNPNANNSTVVSGDKLQKFIDRRNNRRYTLSGLQRMGVSLSMHTNHLSKRDIYNAVDGYYDDYEFDDSGSDTELDSSKIVGRHRSRTTTSAMSSLPESDAESIPPIRRRSLSIGSNNNGTSPQYEGGNSEGYFSIPQHGHTRTPSGVSQKSSSGLLQPPPTTSSSARPTFSRTPSGLSEVYNSNNRTPDNEDANNSGNESLYEFPVKSAPGTPRGYNNNGSKSGTSTPKGKRPEMVSRPSLMKTLSHSKSIVDIHRAQKLRPNFSGQTIPHTEVYDDVDSGNRTIMFKPKKNKKSSSESTENTPLLEPPKQQQQRKTSAIPRQPSHSSSDDEGNNNYLSFNDLPAKAQHVILNDMMRSVSKESAVIFSTLPAPLLGTHKSEEDSLEYVNSLELWCKDLPPIVLLHSQSMTVTTAL